MGLRYGWRSNIKLAHLDQLSTQVSILLRWGPRLEYVTHTIPIAMSDEDDQSDKNVKVAYFHQFRRYVV